MKNALLILFLFSLCQICFGQNSTIQRDELLFEKGLLIHEIVSEEIGFDQSFQPIDSLNKKSDFVISLKETLLEKALEHYQELIDSFPNSKLLYRALNNKGIIEVELDDLDEAKITFLRILNSNANDREKGGIGKGIMAEPYANYKNRAAKTLARIYIKEEKYKEALTFLDQTKKFSYSHFCGNEFAADEIFRAEMYAKCYIGLNEYKEAYEFLLPNLIENGLASNTDLVNTAFKALLKSYSKADLKLKYEQAFKNYKIQKVMNGSYEYNNYYITFLNTKIPLSSFRLEYIRGTDIDAEITNIYKESTFYSLLNN